MLWRILWLGFVAVEWAARSRPNVRLFGLRNANSAYQFKIEIKIETRHATLDSPFSSEQQKGG